MAKNPFKKDSIIDTAINVCTGGAANALVDMAVNYIFTDPEKAPSAMTVNIGKFVGGVVLGSMAGKNQMLRAAVDGIATVGVSNLVSDLVANGFDSESGEGTSGFKRDVMGRVRAGHSRLARRIKKRGVGNAPANPIMG